MRKAENFLTKEELEKLRKVDFGKRSGFVNAEDILAREAGEIGSKEREDFDAKAKAWFYGEVLKDRRKEIGMTQNELAQRIGCKRTYINRIEKGETDLQLSSFIRITKALGITLRLDVNLA